MRLVPKCFHLGFFLAILLILESLLIVETQVPRNAARLRRNHKRLSTRRVSYSGYKILRITPRTNRHYMLINQLEFTGHIKTLGVTRSTPFGTIAVLVPPDSLQTIRDFCTKHQLRNEVVVEDYQKLIDMSSQTSIYRLFDRSRSRKKRIRRSADNSGFNLNKYNSWSEISSYLMELPRRFPELVRIKIYGKSTEGRPLIAVNIGLKSNPKDGSPVKPVLMIDAGIHAREWVTISSALCLVTQIASSYQTDAFVKQYQWVVVPVVNPDGYDFSWRSDRLWRKTRSAPVSDLSIPDGRPRECWGVDPNRNWGTHWGEKGVQRFNVCSEVYAGPRAFSEPEVAALSDLIESYRERIQLYISLHAFSQVILAPFGYSSTQSADFNRHLAIMRSGAAAIKAASGLTYNVGSVYNAMYAASGSSIDFIYEGLGVANPFVIELRDTGKFGFVLPQSQILPTCQEAISAIFAMAAEAAKQKTAPRRRSY